MFLGAIAVTTYAAHKLWPVGFPYGGKEEWETREVPKRVQKVKEDLFEKREEVHQKFNDLTHGRRPALEGRHGRSDSTTSVGSSNGRRRAEHDRERIYYEERESRRQTPASWEREGRTMAEPETIWVDRDGRRVEPPPRNERVYRRQETRYEVEDGGARLVGRSREEVGSPQPPLRSGRLMLEDSRDRARAMPWQQDGRQLLQEETSSRTSSLYPEPTVANAPRHEKVTARKERTVIHERAISPPDEWERPLDTGRERRWTERTKERYEVATDMDPLVPRDHERNLDLPLREITKERREIYRGRDSSPPRDLERYRDLTPKRKVIETREMIREGPASPFLDYDRDLEPSRERDKPQIVTVTEQKETIRQRDVSTPKAARDRQPEETVIEHRELVRRRASSPTRDYDRDREYDVSTEKVVRERHDVVRDRSPYSHYEYKRTRDQPREIREEHTLIREQPREIREEHTLIREKPREIREEHTLIRELPREIREEHTIVREQPRETREEHTLIRERGMSPPRDRERTRERRYHGEFESIEDSYLELPLHTRRKSLSPMMTPRRGDRERLRDDDIVYL